MSVSIVTGACTFAPDRSSGLVVVESDVGHPPFNAAFDELTGSDATTLALNYASQMGCAPAHLNGNRRGPYAVNADGIPLEEVRDENKNPYPPQHPKVQPARYRVDIPVTRPMR